jgi:hypothetical protein
MSLTAHFKKFNNNKIKLTNMAKSTESVRIEVKNKDQATLLNYALGLVHQHLAERMAEVADDKLDHFMDNVKWTRKHANTLNEKFSLVQEDS